MTVPAGSPAGSRTPLPCARDPALGERERGQALGRPRFAGGGDRLRADEARLLLAAPAQPGLDRVAVGAEVVAVEVKADLEAQRVARAEAGGRGAAVQQRVPEGGGGSGRKQDLHPVLARIARAADQEHSRHVLRFASGRAGCQPVRVHARWELSVHQLAHDPARVRALDRQHRVVVETIDQFGVERVRVPAKPLEVGLVVGGVGDGQVAIVGQAIGEQVVQHASVLATEDRVLGTADGELRHVVRQQLLEEVERARTGRLDLAHVRDVEHAAAGAHGEVLGDDALVGHGHLPARERDQLRPRREMAIVKRGALEGGRRVHARQATAGPNDGGAPGRGPRHTLV